MRKHDIEASKPTSSREHRSELTEAQLSQVSGGAPAVNLFHACATGKHFATGKITV